MNIDNDYTMGCYLNVAHTPGNMSVMVCYTGMMNAYIDAALKVGINAPFYGAETDEESLYYANLERNQMDIYHWLRTNGGIDAWMDYEQDHSTPQCQVNPRFDVDDQYDMPEAYFADERMEDVYPNE
jgi:hypothetical protein